MNKLQVALKLLQLLNERQYIDSKIVANEFHVSIRTAQRYLVDLSFMPCVINLDNSSKYALNPDYKLKDIIVNAHHHSSEEIKQVNGTQMNDIKHSLCLLCGEARNYFNNKSIFASSKNIIKNRYEIDKLASMIKKSLASKKCSFP